MKNFRLMCICPIREHKEILHSSFLILHLLACHNIKHQSVRLVHSLRTNLRQVTDTLVNVLVNDSFHRSNAPVFHRHDGGKDCSRHTGRHLQCSARLGSIAYHSRQISNHVLHSISYLLICASHQPGDATAGTCSCHHATA